MQQNQNKTKILLIGTFHMGDSPDIIQTDIGNLSLPKRQDEIKEVVEKLKAFKPNKVAVEIVKEKESELNEDYERYLTNSLELEINEVHQIGFRLSAAMENEQVYPIDWMGNVGQRDIGEVLEWAKTNQVDLYQLIMEYYIPKIEPKLSGLSILEMLVNINEKERIQIDHELYMQLARIGKGTDYIGIDWMRWWYQRNLTIYTNLTQLIVDPNDRILLLIGAAHLHLVSQFLHESGMFEIENATDYLQL